MSVISYSQAPGNRSAPIIPAPWSEADRLTRRLAASGLARLQEQFWGSGGAALAPGEAQGRFLSGKMKRAGYG